MTRQRVTVIDLVAKGPARSLYARLMNANLASIMPQAIAAWCEELGHDVRYVCFTGFEDVTTLLGHETDIVFIASFSRSAQLAYTLASLYAKRGAVTVLGGPHARCFPDHAVQFFDYVLGFTDKPLIDGLLRDAEPRKRLGQWLSAARQPASLPGAASRWRFIADALAKAPLLKIVPMIGSMGCPYTCSFCIDSTVDYQPLGFDQLREDLRFVASKHRRPIVGWHDPNFGVRFNDYMEAIETAVPRGRMRFIAESSLSLLSESNLRRLKQNGFVGMMPGIESWFDLGAKSKTGLTSGMEKVRPVANHVNLVLRHIPFVQTNFVLGLDSDEGAEPFELTKRFIDLTPGAYPAFNMFTAYGRAAPLNLDLQRAGRVRAFPFFFLDGNHAMNVQPLNYGWRELYRLSADLAQYSLTGARVWRRLAANGGVLTRLMNFVRATSSRRARYHANLLGLLESDHGMRAFFDGQSQDLPPFYISAAKRSLGPLWEALPAGALAYDPNAYANDPAAFAVAKPRRPAARLLAPPLLAATAA